MSDCVKRIIEKSKGALNAAEAKELINSVDRIAQSRVRQGFDYDESVKSILVERAENVAVNLKKQKENVIRNIGIKTALNKRIDDRMAKGLTLRQAMLAETEGIQSNVAGTRYSVDAQIMGVEAQYYSKLLRDLSKEDLLPVFNSKQLDTEISRELWDLSLGEVGGSTGSKQALKIAKVVLSLLLELQVEHLQIV